MADIIDFGIRLPTAGPLATAENLAQVAQWADELGFASIWLNDFVVWTRSHDATLISVGSIETLESAQNRPDYVPNHYDPFVSLGYVAALTKRVRLGIAVLAVPLHNPIRAAKQIATLDVLSNGRLILGVGVGSATPGASTPGFEILRVPRGDRYKRTREYLKIMREIWTNPLPSFEGEYFAFPPTEFNPKPLQKPHPPIWVGGKGPKAIELAQDFGSGWLPARVRIEEYPALINRLHEGIRSKRKSDSQMVIGSEVIACLADDDSRAWDMARKTIEIRSSVHRSDDEDALRTLNETSLVGSPAAICERVERFAHVGVTHFQLKVVYPHLAQLRWQLERFATSVLPRFS